MSFRDKLDVQRLFHGAVLLGAIALAWKFEKPHRVRTAAAPAPVPAADRPAAPFPQPFPQSFPAPEAFAAFAEPLVSAESGWLWWKRILIDTYGAMNDNRLLAVAAGVVFYALLAMVPAITAFVSLYGLFADRGTVQENLASLAGILPAGGVSLLDEQISRIAALPAGLGVGFAAGVLIALWSANAGVKAMIDALNVIEERPETRSFVRLNALSLGMTLGAIVFLLLAAAAVIAFPLAMSMLGLKEFTATTTWLVRWPLLLAMMMGALAVFYRFAPSRSHALRRWFSPGVALAALAWLAGSAALSYYLSHFADYNATYGSLGAAIGLMMWMWLSTIVVLFGAELDTVIDRSRSPPIAPI